MDALRATDGALMTTAELVGRVIAEKGFDAGDTALRKAISEQCWLLFPLVQKKKRSSRLGSGAECDGSWPALSRPRVPWYLEGGSGVPAPARR